MKYALRANGRVIMARSNDLEDINRAREYMEKKFPEYYWTIGPDKSKGK